MRRKKENINLPKSKEQSLEDLEDLAEERAERYEEFNGEEATEGVGPGFTNEPELEKSIETGDGPVAGESMEPPTEPQRFGAAKSRVKKIRKRMPARAIPKSSHVAARSSKKI